MAKTSVPDDAPVVYPPVTVMQFDGSGDSIDCGSGASLNLTKTLTFEAWVKCENARGGFLFIKVGANGAYHYAGYIQEERDNIIFAHSTATKKNVMPSLKCEVPRHKWLHIAVVFNSKQVYLVADGQPGESKAVEGEILDNENLPLRLGHGYNRPGYFFQGQMAEVRVWNVARTADEIKNHMSQRLRGDEPGLAGYWPLDDGSGTTANDKTKNGNHGTIHGATWFTADDLQLVPAPKPKKKKTKKAAKGKTATSDPTLHIPAAQPRTLHATGLEDYNYWWETLLKQQLAKQKKSEAKKPYRRGRIWS
ncbi:MAG: LamG-like jellyroll fold domain-containing protein [Cyanobacteria bacterium P01_D01_bin.105]